MKAANQKRPVKNRRGENPKVGFWNTQSVGFFVAGQLKRLMVCAGVLALILASLGVLNPLRVSKAQAASGIAHVINYQGRLLRANGGSVNVHDGTYQMIFRLYTQPTGGSHVWSASTTNALPAGTPASIDVVVQNGLFSILLGDANNGQVAFPENLFDSDTLYLGVQIDADSEMTPRKRLSAIPYAYNSETLQGQYASKSVASTGGNLFALNQNSQDEAMAARTAFYVHTSGTSNTYDYLMRANSGTDVFTINRQGNVTTTGNLQVNGYTVLGESSSDRLNIKAQILSDLIPAVDSTYSLGSAALRWNHLYATSVSTTNLEATGYVSTTQIIVNGSSLTIQPTLQQVTEWGNVTNRMITVNGVTTTGDVLANSASIYNIGATSTPFKAIYVDELYMSGQSLYMNGKKVLQSVGALMNFTADTDQTLQVQTSGSGNLQFDSAGSGNVLFTTTGSGNIAFSSVNQTQFTSSNAINFQTNNPNADIILNALGANSQVRASAVEEIDLTAPLLDFNGNADISGTLTLGNHPTLTMQAATKGYVDQRIGNSTSTLQSVTNNGYVTTNPIRVNGVSSTASILPTSNNLYDLGSSSSYWRKLYAYSVSSTNVDALGYVSTSRLYIAGSQFSPANYFVQNGNSFNATGTLGTNDNFNLALKTNGTTRVVIKSDGKVGIGTVNPAGTLELGTGQLLLPNGSVAAPSLSYSSYKNYGIYFNASTGMVFSHNGVDTAGIRSYIFTLPSNSQFGWTAGGITANFDTGFSRGAAGKIYAGNGVQGSYTGTLIAGALGVGTTDPVNKLTITSNGAVDNDADIGFNVTSSATTLSWTMGTDKSDGGKFKISSSTALGTNDRFVIDGRGYFGFGTSNPYLYKLTVAGTIAPSTTNAYDLGSAAHVWRNLYATNVSSTNIDALGYVSTSRLYIAGSQFTTGNYFAQNGNSFSTTGTMGTNDNYNLAFETNNSVKMLVTNDGKIGIGTLSPTASLDVKGNAKFGATGSDGRIDLPLTTSGFNPYVKSTFASNTFEFGMDGLSYMRFDGAGNSTIGGTLTVSPANGNPGLIVNQGSVAWQTIADFKVQNASKMIIQSSGNVGIGTSNPYLYKLTVTGTIAPSTTNSYDLGSTAHVWRKLYVTNVSSTNIDALGYVSTSRLYIAGSQFTAGNYFTQNGNSFNTTGTLGTNDSKNLAFETNNSVRMVVTAAGRVGIGTLSPNGLLHVSGGSDYTDDQCTGGTASASSSYTPPSFIADKAFDDDPITLWGSDNLDYPHFLKYDFTAGNAKIITKYRIYYNDDQATWLGYDWSPDDWTFEGSNDDSNWDILDTRVNQGWSVDGWKEYAINNFDAYRYYRINVTSNKGGTMWKYVAIHEFEMLESSGNSNNSLVVSATSGKVGINTASAYLFQLTVGGHVGPSTTNAYDLGGAAHVWRKLYVTNVSSTNIDALGYVSTSRLYVNGSLFSTPNLQAVTDNGYVTTNPIRVNGVSSTASILPTSNNLYDLGSAANSWRNVYVSSTAYFGGANPSLRFTATSTLVSNPTNAGGNTGFVFDTASALSVNGSKLISVKNGGTEKAYLDLNGFWYAGRYVSTAFTFIGPGLSQGGNAAGILFSQKVTNDVAINAGGGGVDYFRLYISPNGNIGVGKNSPQARLHVATSTNTGQPTLLLTTQPTSSAPALKFTATGTIMAVPTDAAGNSAFVFDTPATLATARLFSVRNGGSEKFYITADGTVSFDKAIFTHTTTTNLAVSGFVHSNLIPGLDNTYDLGSSTQRWRRLNAVNVSSTNIDALGYVSTSRLYIAGSQYAPGNFFAQNGNSFSTTGTLGTNDNYNLAFETNGTNRMVIKNDGNIGMGAINPINKLTLTGTGAASADADIGFNVTSSATVMSWTMGVDKSDAGKFKISSSTALGTNDKFVINGKGNVNIGAPGSMLGKLNIVGEAGDNRSIDASLSPTLSTGAVYAMNFTIDGTNMTGNSGLNGINLIVSDQSTYSGTSYLLNISRNSTQLFGLDKQGELKLKPLGYSGWSTIQYDGTNTAGYGFVRGSNLQTGLALRNAIPTDNGTGVGLRLSITSNSAYGAVTNLAAKALLVTNGFNLSDSTGVFNVTAGGKGYFKDSIGINAAAVNKLTITSNGAVDNDADIGFNVTSSATTLSWTMGTDKSDGGKFKISSSTALGTNDRFVIDGRGYFGFGTSNPYLYKLTVAGTIAPSTTNAYDLGSAAHVWRKLYVTNVSSTNVDALGYVSTTKLYVAGTEFAASNYFVQNGNSFSTTGTIGTNDNYNLAFETNNATRLILDTDGTLFPQSNTYNLGKAETGSRFNNLFLNGSIYATGTLFGSGVVTFGNSTSGGSFSPSDNGQYSLGSDTYRWRNLFANNVSSTNIDALGYVSTSRLYVNGSLFSTPDLQAVTDNGYVTTNPIQVNGVSSTASILPTSNSVYDLGSSASNWRRLHATFVSTTRMEATASVSTTKLILSGTGSAASPSIHWGNDTGTGFYKSAVGILDVTAAGSQMMRISNNGFFMLGNSQQSSDKIWGWGAGVAGVAGNDLALSRYAAGTLGVGTGAFGNIRGTLLTGNIGLFGASPANRLTINQNGAATNDADIGFNVTSSATTLSWTMGADKSDGGKFKISSSTALGTNDRLVINGKGYVGIGTANPVNALDVNGNLGMGGYNWNIKSGYSDGNWGFGVYSSGGAYYSRIIYGPAAGQDRRGGIMANDSSWIAYGDGSKNFIIVNKTGLGMTNPYLFQLTSAGSIGPSSTNAYDLGASTHYWRKLYANYASTTALDALSYVSTTKLYLNGTEFTGGSQNLQQVTDVGYITTNPIRVNGVSSTADILPTDNDTYDLGAYGHAWQNIYASGTTQTAKLEVLNNSDATALTIRANSTQSNTNPLFKILKADGTVLASMHSDNPANLFIGANAGRVNNVSGVGNEGVYNTFLGASSGLSNTTGQQNTGVGFQSLYSNTTGQQNTAVGLSALFSNTRGNYNSAVGFQALNSNTEGNYNAAMGYNALYSNTTGSYNTAFGLQSLFYNQTGNYNAAMGLQALLSNVSGSNNSALGLQALTSNTTGNNNAAFGYNSLFSNTTGNDNAALGLQALYYNKSATNTTAVGGAAGQGSAAYSNQNGTYIGYRAGFSVRTGSDNNTMIGYGAGYNNTIGANNIFVGYQAGSNITTGSNNIVIGYNVEAPSPTGDSQLNIGNTLFGNLSTGNIGIGVNNPYLYKLTVAGTVAPSTTNSYDLGGTAHYWRKLYANYASTTALDALSYVSTTKLYLNGTEFTGGSQNLQQVTDVGYVTNRAIRVNGVSSTASILPTANNSYNLGAYGRAWQNIYASGTTQTAKLEVLNNSDATALTIRANSTQSNTNPLFKLVKADGTELSRFHSDNATTLFVGINAGRVNTAGSGTDNYFIGNSAGYSNTTGDRNIAIGSNALYGAAGTTDNISIGYYAAQHASLSADNIAIGSSALRNNTGSNNVGIGSSALYNNTGSNNTVLGYNAIRGTGNGYSNTAIGDRAQYSLTSGYENIALGQVTLYTNQTGSNNIAVGNWALYAGNGSTFKYNTAMGHQAAANITTGGYNTALGMTAMNVISTGSNNTGIGNSALYRVGTGSYNSAVGDLALYGSNGLNFSYNSALGTNALRGIGTNGNYNTAIGYGAGYSGTALTTETYNTFLGTDSGLSKAGVVESTAIGYNARVGRSQSVVIGASNASVGIGTSNPYLFKLTVNGHVGPSSTNLYDLGGTTHYWRKLYAKYASTTGIDALGYVSTTNSYAVNSLIKGKTATYAEKLIRVQNSAGTGLFSVVADGRTYVGPDTGGNAWLTITRPNGDTKAVFGVQDLNTAGNPSLNFGSVATGGVGGTQFGFFTPNSIFFGNGSTWYDEFVKTAAGQFYLQPGRSWGTGGDILTINPATFTSGKFINLKIGTASKLSIDLNGNLYASGTVMGAGGRFYGDVIPGTTVSYDLGSSTNYWRKLFVKNVSSTNIDALGYVSTSKLYLNGSLFAGVPHTQGGNAFGVTSTIGTTENKNLTLITNNASRLTILGSNGNVGIGTVNPVSRLNVGGTTGITWSNSGPSSGLVTIGDTTGGSVWINTGGYSAIFNAGLAVSGSMSYARNKSYINMVAYGVKANGYSSELTLSTTNESTVNEAMRIIGNGNIGIGTTSPTLFKLQIAGNVGPSSTNAYDLGSSSYYWRKLYSTYASTTGLDASGYLSSAKVIAAYGTVDAPSFTFQGDPNTGIFHQNSADTLSLVTNGVERVMLYDNNFVLRRYDASRGGMIGFEAADALAGVNLKAPLSIANGGDDITFTLPDSFGSDGQVLQTDADGNLSWANNNLGVTPLFKNQVALNGTSYTATDVAISGDIVAAVSKDLPNEQVDILQIRNGSLISKTAIQPEDVTSIKIVGSYLFANSGGWLYIYDISDVENASLVGSVEYDLTSNDSWIDISGRYAYVGGSSDGKLYIIDISDKTAPTLVNTITLSGINGIKASYPYLVVGRNGAGITTYNITNAPSITSIDTNGYTNVAAFDYEGTMLYVLETDGTLTGVDMSTPGTPVEVQVAYMGRAVTNPAKLIAHQGMVYFLEHSNYFSAYRSTASSFSYVYSSTSAGTFGDGQAMAIQGNNLVTYAGSVSTLRLSLFDLQSKHVDALTAGTAETGDLTVLGRSKFNTDVTIGGGAYINGTLQANNSLSVSGLSKLKQVQVDGNVAIRKLASAATESWDAAGMTTTGVPTARDKHTMVWAGSKAIVWGGLNGATYLKTGAKYDPVTDSWSDTTQTGAPLARSDHSAVWTGNKMIVWGGTDARGVTSTGSLYDPKTNAWSAITNTGAPTKRKNQIALWTGSKMIIWGGIQYNGAGTTTGAIYDPVANSWSAISGTGQQPCINSAAVWTGTKLLVWGGWNTMLGAYCGGYSWTQSGGWVAMSSTNAPTGRYAPTGIWTGNKFIVWGGYTSGNVAVNSGGIYDPDTDTWSSITATNAPSARHSHTAVWTGTNMVIWAGTSTTAVANTGASYNPVGNTWTTLSTTNAAAARMAHTAVWTGSKMLVWGGHNNITQLDTGGLYNPVNYYQGNLMVEGDAYFNSSIAIVGLAKAGGFYSLGGADFAEYMPHDNAGLSAGDLVALSSSSTGTIVKASAENKDRLVGVITDTPAMVGNAKEAYQNDPDHYALVSMLGQVNVKFSPVMGEVSAGDWLMAGDDGYAVKAKGAGMVLGRALQNSNATSTVLTYVKPIYWAGGLLASDGSVDLVKNNLAMRSKGIASAGQQGFDSEMFSFNGSGWDSMASGTVATSFSLYNHTVNASTSEFVIAFSTGTNSARNKFKVNNLGDTYVGGDLTVGKRLFLGSKVNGQGSTSTYIYIDDTLSPTSTYVATNADGWQTQSTYDYAERYESSEDLIPGDLVTADASGINKIRRAISSAEPILGIVSTRPGFVTGAYAKGNYPIALAGRVPTRVSTANGVINVGDYLAISGTPGVAVRATSAGNVVGIALESYESPEEGLISVFVKPGYYAGTLATTGPEAGTVIVNQAVQPVPQRTEIEGLASIMAGASKVHISYGSILAYPMVYVTPHASLDQATWWIENRSDTGFDIVISQAQTHDVEFTWMARPMLPGTVRFVSDNTAQTLDNLTAQIVGPVDPSAQPLTEPIINETSTTTQPTQETVTSTTVAATSP